MSLKQNKRQETLIYLVLWGLLFIAPVMNLYIRTAGNSELTFDWNEVLILWRGYGVFFAIFLIHNHLLAPMLVYRQRRTLYVSVVGILIALFIVWQCNSGPDKGPRPWMKERSERFEGKADRFDDRRPPMDRDADDRRPPMDMGADDRPPMNDMGDRRPPEWDEGGPGDKPFAKPPLPPNGKPDKRPPLMYDQHDIIALIILILMLGANLGIKLYFKQRRDQKQMAELERQNLEQQLEYLKYQINPHFLMNTLNNIHALVDIDPERSKQTIVELSKLLRFMLYEGSKPTVPLGHELAFLEDYIALMRLRYTDKVAINFHKPAELPDVQVPPLLFITFVENAFKHGVSYRQESFIDILIEVREISELVFTCRNSRIPEADDKHGGVGLQNVKQRLELIYGKNFTLDIQDKPDEYNIRLSIPLLTTV